MIRSSGITERARNESAPKGQARGDPSSAAACRTARSPAQTSATSADEMSPATGSGRLALASPPETTTKPPPSSASARAASSMSPGFVPATMRLWESWATDEAMAPWRLKPNPETRPTPTLPVARWRSIDATRATSRAGSKAKRPSARPTSRVSWRVTICSGTIPMTRARPPARGSSNAEASSGAMFTLFAAATAGAACSWTYRPASATTRPSLTTSTGSKRARSPATSRSARQPGQTAPLPGRP